MCRCTTSCLLVHLSSAYPDLAMLFQFLIALDFSSHYMHMYRYALHQKASSSLTVLFESYLKTGSKSHKLVKSDVSRILSLYYTDSVSRLFLCPCMLC